MGIFSTPLKGEMCSGDYLSMGGGRLKCSGMRDSMVSSILAITYICPESDRYAEKSSSGSRSWYKSFLRT